MRVAAGPGLRDDWEWLAEQRRDGLVAELLRAGRSAARWRKAATGACWTVR